VDPSGLMSCAPSLGCWPPTTQPAACQTLGPKTPVPYQWAECAYDTLGGDELSPVVDAAVVANLQAESLYFEDWDKTVCYKGTCGFGIGQWTVPGPRYTPLTKFAGAPPSFVDQVQFVNVELTTDYSFVLSNVNRAIAGMTSLSEELETATRVVEEEYEAPTGVSKPYRLPRTRLLRHRSWLRCGHVIEVARVLCNRDLRCIRWGTCTGAPGAQGKHVDPLVVLSSAIGWVRS